MSLLTKIEEDFQGALKGGDAQKLSVLRLIKSALEVKTKEKGETVTEEQALQVLKQEAKKREEAAKLYEQSAKGDLAQKERQELELIKTYLPAELPDEAIVKVIDEVRTAGAAEFPQIMGQVMAKLRGQADGGRVAELVKKSLQSNK